MQIRRSRVFVAFGVGLIIVIAADSLFTFGYRLPFTVSFLLSLVLGLLATTAIFILVPAPELEIADPTEQMSQDFDARIRGIRALSERITHNSRMCGTDEEIATQLASVATMAESIAQRYESRSRDFMGASSLHTVMDRFNMILIFIQRIRCGELNVEPERAAFEIAQFETKTVPLIHAALNKLGRQLDSGEVANMQALIKALTDMVSSLNLIDSLTEEHLRPLQRDDSDSEPTDQPD